MKIEKQELKVNIVLQDGLILTGFVHINPGERLQDYINDARRDFIAVTNVQFLSAKKINFGSKLTSKDGDIILNKSAISWLKEAYR